MDTIAAATPFKEQFRVSLSNAGKVRNRTEAYLIEFAQLLLAKPVPLTLEQVQEGLNKELVETMKWHPSWGVCRVSDISTFSTIKGKPWSVTRNLAIYGRGRGIFSLLICETVRKDARNGYAPILD